MRTLNWQAFGRASRQYQPNLQKYLRPLSCPKMKQNTVPSFFKKNVPFTQSSLRSPVIESNDNLVDNLTKIDWQSAARCTVWT